MQDHVVSGEKVKAQIVAALPEHIEAIANHVREADREELWEASCSTPQAVMERALMVSSRAWTGLIDGVPVCMFGAAPVSSLSETGRPWMVGTDHLDRHSKLFLRRCRHTVAAMLEDFPVLENYVDARNVRAIEWLRWLGFTFSEPESMGPFGKPFIKFEMRREAYV
jgi:hypothetical protein